MESCRERCAPRDARRHRRGPGHAGAGRAECLRLRSAPRAHRRAPRRAPLAGRHGDGLLHGELPGAGGAAGARRRGAHRAADVRTAAPGRPPPGRVGHAVRSPSRRRLPPRRRGRRGRHDAAHARRRPGESAQSVESLGPTRDAAANWRSGPARGRARDGRRDVSRRGLRRPAGLVRAPRPGLRVDQQSHRKSTACPRFAAGGSSPTRHSSIASGA